MNVPKIRFKEFTDSWKYEKLNNYVKRITTKNKNNESDLVLTISAQYGLVDQCKFFNRNVASSNLTGYYLLNKGDFAYNKSYSNGYPWGAIKRLNKYKQGVVSSLYICFNCNDKINPNFLEQYFETNKWYHTISNVSVEGARNHGLLNIAVDDFFNTEHFIPSIQEQNKIASFLSLLDKKIELQTKKVEALKLYKMCIISTLFKEAKDRTKLKNICDCKSSSLSIEQLEFDEGEYKLYGANGLVKSISNYLFEQEYIGIIKDGASVGKTMICDKESSVLGTLNALFPINVDINYLNIIINRINFKKYIVGSGIPHIYFKDYKNESLLIHSKDLQEKIGLLIKEYNNKILFEKNKLNMIILLKKGLMQSMFV